MRSFSKPDKIFDGGKPDRQTENHIDRGEAPELKPG
jgi:hypothetical protein